MKIKQFTALLTIKSVRNKNWLLMKLSLSFYLLGCLQLLAINSFSQNKITLNETNTPLETILQEIEAQTSYRFIYNNDIIDIKQKLNINIMDESIDIALNRLFKNVQINYLLKKNHIILSSRHKSKISQQEKFTLSGTIKDSTTGETLLGATILIKDNNKGVVTNEYGFYSITLPSENYNIQISYVGYRTKEIDVQLTKNIKLNISLTPSENQLEEVVISSESKSKSQVHSTLLGVTKMRSAEIKQLPALLGEPDITRAILTLPGVSSVGEGTTGFNVRGGNIDQNLILLDEAPIYNSSHVWGFFSIFNADAVKSLKLYKGGIPARFGGRVSSVLDIRQREGNNKNFKGEGGLGLLFSRLTLEGPIKKDKVSYLVSGRRSYFDLFFPLVKNGVENNKIYFYDLNSKLTWNINDNNKLFVSGYFGADVMKLKLGLEEDNNTSSKDNGSVNFEWNNTTATARWNHLFSDRLFMNLSGIYSKYNYGLNVDNGSGPNNRSGSFTWKSSIENWIFKPDFTFYQNPASKFRFGIHSTLYKFKPAEIKTDEIGINEINLDTEKGLEIAPYIEYEKKWNKVTINAGLRFSWFGNIGPYNVAVYDKNLPMSVSTITGAVNYKKGEVVKSYTGLEPRLSFKYAINNRKSFKLGYNRMFQYIHIISNTTAALPFDIWKPSGAYIKPIEVNQISAGYAFDTSNDTYNFSFEGYYKTFKNIIEYKNGADLFVNKNLESQLLPAKGFAYGAELGLYKNKGKLTGNINYTYAVTKRKTLSNFNSENINRGSYYPSNYDRPHLLNLTANYKLNKKWNLNTFFTYQTGRPSTKVTGKIVIDGVTHLTYSDRNAYRIPDTHRLDVAFNYIPKGNPNTKWQSSWSFGIYNIYGRKNAFSTYSTFSNKKLKTFQFSVIGSPIPFITYNFKF